MEKGRSIKTAAAERTRFACIASEQKSLEGKGPKSSGGSQRKTGMDRDTQEEWRRKETQIECRSNKPSSLP